MTSHCAHTLSHASLFSSHFCLAACFTLLKRRRTTRQIAWTHLLFRSSPRLTTVPIHTRHSSSTGASPELSSTPSPVTVISCQERRQADSATIIHYTSTAQCTGAEGTLVRQHSPTKLDPFHSVQCSAPIPRGKSSAKDRHKVVQFAPTSPSLSLNVTSSSTLSSASPSEREPWLSYRSAHHTYIHTHFVDDNCWAELYSHRRVQRRALLPPRQC